jgi:putative oxidoreductase
MMGTADKRTTSRRCVVSILVLVGRILFVVLFLGSSFGHLTQSQAMAGYTASKGVPAARLAVLVTGVMQLAGGLSVLLGVWGDLGALLLFLFLAPTAVIMHNFWREKDAGGRMNERIQFLKDLSLAGAALMIAALFMYAGHHLGLTLTGPAFHLS